ncbi:uncharacterized protein OCT59_015219 [Rhizophagus irregularis]|uniref:uncharacterized protein n=1 Tax=Rhizophagus irregularis TaxID=588596 RepID=UPI00332EDC08|nr:hypothetical protein OCT59_015219 [Rhizophagus irregularis]
MELVNTNDENFFDPTPRLKSSPIPIQFISFGCQHSCVYCGEKYIETLLCSRQKYCKKCLSRYINDIIDDNIYFEIYYYTIDSECNGHEINKIKKDILINVILITIFLTYTIRVKPIRWISYSQFTDVKEMTKGGYGIIYKATLLSNNETVILKRIENSNNNNEYFLNELKSNQYFSQSIYIIEVFGYTKDPELKDYILVMSYASKGDLYKYLQKNFTIITWYEKLRILQKISMGLRYIHGNNFIHRDFHSGNILLDVYDNWKIGDLGLSQSANDPRLQKIHRNTIDNIDYNQAEAIRKKLIESKKIGPEFAEKWHSEAIYTSRPLSALISKLSTNSYSTISFGNKQDYNYNYISKEKELDIDIKSLLSQNITIQNSSISLKKRNNKELNPETQSDSVGKRIKTSIIASLKSRW